MPATIRVYFKFSFMLSVLLRKIPTPEGVGILRLF